MEQMTLYVGAVAGIFTGVSMLPQLIKIIKEKKAQAISFFMLVVLMTGLAGWIWYGILKKDLPVIFTNIFSFIINVLVVIFSYKYKKNNKEENE
ncbi:MAG: SemiSWEET transporter [Chitinophagaceae bacterium]